MKRMKYGGTYKVEPGDFLVYQDNGKSVITERELREREIPAIKVLWMWHRIQYNWKLFDLREEQKMNNYFMLDGKQIPMSNETAASLREEQKTYKWGDCFKVGICRDTIVMLTVFDRNRNLIGATCIRGGYNGSRWTKPKTVGNFNKITEEELRSILDTNIIIPVTVKVEIIK